MTSPRTERRVLGGAVRRIREAKGKSLAGIAKPADVTVGYLSKLETGVKNNASLKVMVGLARALEVDLDDITYLTVVYVVAEEDAVA